MKQSRSPLLRGMLAVGAAVFASHSLPASAAEALTVQSYLERILGGVAPADIGVLQTSPTRFRARVKTGLLFKAFQLEPTLGVAPREAQISAEDLGSGRWRFEASDDFWAATDDEIDGKARKTLARAARAELKGVFDPARGGQSQLGITYLDGDYSLTVGDEKFKVNYRKTAFFLDETTGEDRLSRSKVGVTLDGFTFDMREPSFIGQVLGKSFTYSIEADGLNYRSLKDQIRFGDRLKLHSSEGDLDYPQQSAAAMRDFKARLSGTGITSTEGAEGFRAASLDIGITGKVPSDEAKAAFSFDAKTLEFVGPAGRRFYLPFIPADISVKGNLTGIDFRKLYLRSNILSNLGTTLDEDHFDDNFVPSGTITLTGIDGSLTHDKARFDFKGEATFYVDTMTLADLTVEFRSRNIDAIIAANTERARKDRVAGTLQFILFFLKGVAKPEGDTSLWTVVHKDGRTTINGSDLGNH